MTLDEAYTEAVCGMDLTAAHLQPGVVLTYRWKGFLREWPNGMASCDFIPTPEDEAADWFEYVRPEPIPEPSKWGAPKPASVEDAMAAAFAAKAAREAAPKPDPLAGCGPAVSSPWGPVKAAPGLRDAWGRPIDG